jgi:hypothetical protein
VKPVGAVLGFALLFLTASPARGEGSFADANRAYSEQRYREAIAQYEALIAAGIVHEDLYYNLGNAYFRHAERHDHALGPAIFNYERALRIDPSMEDAYYNLGVARAAVAAKVADRLEGAEGDPLWVRVVTYFSMAQLTIGFLLLNLGFFSSLVVLRFLSSGLARTGLAVGTVFAGLATAAAAILLGGHIWFVQNVQLAIVLPDQTQLRDAAGAPVAEGAQVHAGLRVRVMQRESSWVRVRLANGYEGWLAAREIGQV